MTFLVSIVNFTYHLLCIQNEYFFGYYFILKGVNSIVFFFLSLFDQNDYSNVASFRDSDKPIVPHILPFILHITHKSENNMSSIRLPRLP